MWSDVTLNIGEYSDFWMILMLDHPDQDLVQSVQVKVVDDLAGRWPTTYREHFTGKLFYVTIYFLIIFTYFDFLFFP